MLELKDRLGAPVGGGVAGGRRGVQPDGWREQVHGALLGLGYAAREADEAVAALDEPAPGTKADVGELLRAALRSLARA